MIGYYIDIVLFIFFLLWVLYVFLFALASKRKKRLTFSIVKPQFRFAVLFPAYKEDNVILSSVSHFQKQDYPSAMYEIVVISDQMRDKTNTLLQEKGIQLLYPTSTNRSKASALNMAMEYLDETKFDAVVIMDADNLADTDFLSRLNDVFVSGAKAVQAHRVAKNDHTETAFLDGISEEINNSIFRKGHVMLGLPSALIGSGMAFDYIWFKRAIRQIDSTGEDKLLEYRLLIDRVFTVYLENVYVRDEKIENSKDFSKQRRRWIASQIDAFILSLKKVGTCIIQGNWPLLDKIFQWSMPPRIIMLGMIPLLFLTSLLLDDVSSIKWFFLYILYGVALALAIPSRYYNQRLWKAILSLPKMFLAMASSILHFRSGRATFIHTAHNDVTEQEENTPDN